MEQRKDLVCEAVNHVDLIMKDISPEVFKAWQSIHTTYLQLKKDGATALVKDIGHLVVSSLRMKAVSKETWASIQ
eukprot:4710216-Karenia_brevis.AAC.1